MRCWEAWCRLCAKEQAEHKFDSVDDINAITSHFPISIPEIKGVALNVCDDCYTFLNKINQFTGRCVQANALLMYLSKCSLTKISDVDVEAIRTRYLGDLDVADTVELTEALDGGRKSLPDNDPFHEIEQIDDVEEVKEEIKSSYMEIGPIDASDDDDDDDDDECYDYDVSDRECWDVIDIKIEEASPIEEMDLRSCVEIMPRLAKKRNTNGKPAKSCRTRNPFRRSRRIVRHSAKRAPGVKIFTETEQTLGFDKRPYSCNVCEKRFSNQESVETHMLTIHEGGKPFVCEECGKRWSTKGSLKEHQIVHSDEYPYHCSYCSKRFKNMPRLKTHEDTHNNTMYVCPHCGLKLNTRRTLQMHMVVHSEERKYKCQHCGKEYKRSKALKAHLILHTGLKPYACPFCDKTFANGSNCRSHKKKFHPLELAALEASGGQQPTANIPKLEQLQPKFSELSGSATVTSIPEIVHHVADPTESVVDKTEKPCAVVVDTASFSEDRASNIIVKKDKLTEVHVTPIRVKKSNLNEETMPPKIELEA